jgi:dUTP pyrophosphatase
MDKGELEAYLRKLESFETQLSKGGEVDQSFMDEIENTLQALSNDSINAVNQMNGDKPQNVNLPKVDFSIDCKIKKLHEDAIIPTYSKEGDGCVDLYSIGYVFDDTKNQVTYSTGIAIEIPDTHVGLVFPRSSIRRTKLTLSNSVGVIDSGYRGEIMATFNYSNSTSSEIYETGERICQLMIIPNPKINFIEVDELSESDRGDGGFGSTGK